MRKNPADYRSIYVALDGEAQRALRLIVDRGHTLRWAVEAALKAYATPPVPPPTPTVALLPAPRTVLDETARAIAEVLDAPGCTKGEQQGLRMAAALLERQISLAWAKELDASRVVRP